MTGEQFLRFRAMDEAQPGAKWQARFAGLWPAYRAWYMEAGLELRSSLEEGRAALRGQMPELTTTFQRLCDLAGDDPTAHRLLTGYCLPVLRHSVASKRTGS